MKNRQRFMDYLAAYARKDLIAIDGLFADDVRLRDWKLCVQGRRAALAETAKNFDSVRSIEIDVLSILESERAVAGELRICIDGEIELFVVDVVEFDERGLICAIRAYLGRPSE